MPTYGDTSSPRTVTLTRYAVSRVFVPNRSEAFRLRVVASDAVDMPIEIFAHQKTLVDPNTQQTSDEFSHVCSPYDLTIYPASAPNPQQFPQYFRKNVVDILLPRSQDVADVWSAIQQDVSELISALNRSELLEDVSVIVGAQPPTYGAMFPAAFPFRASAVVGIPS